MLSMAAFGVLAVIVAAGAYLDLRERRLPNWLSGLALATGLAAGIGLVNQYDWWLFPAHAGLALVLGMGLFAIRWIGGGDAKFYAGLAAWLPLPQAGVMIGAIAISGLLLVMVWFTIRRLKGQPIRNNDPSAQLPFGVAIGAGTLIAYGFLLR